MLIKYYEYGMFRYIYKQLIFTAWDVKINTGCNIASYKQHSGIISTLCNAV